MSRFSGFGRDQEGVQRGGTVHRTPELGYLIYPPTQTLHIPGKHGEGGNLFFLDQEIWHKRWAYMSPWEVVWQCNSYFKLTRGVKISHALAP